MLPTGNGDLGVRGFAPSRWEAGTTRVPAEGGRGSCCTLQGCPSERWKWGSSLLLQGDGSAGAWVRDGGSRAVLPIPLWSPSWGESRCPDALLPTGVGTGPLAWLSPSPHFQGKAGVLSPTPGSHLPNCGQEQLRDRQWVSAGPSGSAARFRGSRHRLVLVPSQCKHFPAVMAALGPLVLPVSARLCQRGADCPAGSQLAWGHPSEP